MLDSWLKEHTKGLPWPITMVQDQAIEKKTWASLKFSVVEGLDIALKCIISKNNIHGVVGNPIYQSLLQHLQPRWRKEIYIYI
jgi:hypothetical protein